MKTPSLNRIGRALMSFLAGTANRGHSMLFGHLVRTGLVACAALTGTDVAAGLDAIRASLAEPLADVRARLLELEQKGVRHNGAGGSLGDAAMSAALEVAFANAKDGLDELREHRHGAKCSIDLPRGYFATPRAAVTGPAPGQTDRPTVIVPLPLQKFTIRSLLPVVPTDAAVISYVAETAFTNLAAPVVEGAVKPQSTMTFALMTAPIVTLAHYAKASTQVLDDMHSLGAFIDRKLRYGLSLTEEAQLLLGSGVGNNLSGLMTGASLFTDGTTGATNMDKLRRCAAVLELAFFEPSGVVMNPHDWAEMELTKDTQGRYIIAVPRSANPDMMWSLPVVSCPTMPAGQYLMADFGQAATLYDRWIARIEIATQSEDDFIHNLITIRAEERVGLATFNPNAMRKGVFA